jgi:cytochrome c oxidase subunit II
MKSRINLLVTLALPVLSGCVGVQSVLDPLGPAAAAISRLSLVMFLGASVIWAAVVLLLLYVLRRDRARALNVRWLIVGGGVVLPVLVLTLLLAYSIRLADTLQAGERRNGLSIEVDARQWWWKVSYRFHGEPSRTVITANEIHLPVGQAVEVRLTSSDVVHSFWIPRLAGKMDAIPGRTNKLLIAADRPGISRGQCAEFCGLEHAHMAIMAISHPADEFDQWLDRQRRPAIEPSTELLRAGQAAFMNGGCASCHAIRGSGAVGSTGPDLTHVGSRTHIAAGRLPTSVGAFAAWIASTQHLKPGAHMPSFNHFDGNTLRALGAYLESLE